MMSKKKGDVILKCKPYAHVLLFSQRRFRCAFCFGRCDELKKCTGCGSLYYCDTKCQRSDWAIHKVECLCLKRCSPNNPVDSVRLFLRLLIRHQKGDHTKKWPNDPGWCCFEDLMSHIQELRSDSTRQDQFAQIIFTIRKLVGQEYSLPSSTDLLDLYGKMVINTFTIYDEECQPIGSGIYNSASKLDHRCHPNSVITFRGNLLELRALTDVQNPSAENVFISYIDQLCPQEKRQSELEKLYYFTCLCERCNNNELNAQMLATRCQDRSCDGAVNINQGNCSKCHEKPQYDEKSVTDCLEKSEVWIEEIEQLHKNKEFENVLESCDNFLKTQGEILHHQNVYVVKCRDKGFQSALETQQWETALTHGVQSVQGFLLYYSNRSPVTGVELMKLGKLEQFMDKLHPAQTHLKQALEIIEVTHGREHPLVQQLIEMIDQGHQELNQGHGEVNPQKSLSITNS